VNLSQGELVALAYGVVFAFVLFYVAIIAAKLARLERETADLVELARSQRSSARADVVEVPDYAGASWEGSNEGRSE
jgi:hypothetical protein